MGILVQSAEPHSAEVACSVLGSITNCKSFDDELLLAVEAEDSQWTTKILSTRNKWACQNLIHLRPPDWTALRNWGRERVAFLSNTLVEDLWPKMVDCLSDGSITVTLPDPSQIGKLAHTKKCPPG